MSPSESIDDHLNNLMSDKNNIVSNFSNVTKENLPDWYDEKLFKL